MKLPLLTGRPGLISLLAAAAGCSLLAPVWLAARPAHRPVPRPTHRVVFEMSVDGMSRWEAVLRNARNVQRSFGAADTQMEIVAHGPGIGLLLKRTSSQNPELAAALQQLHQSGTVFAACRNTLTRLKIAPEVLVDTATIVDSGVAQVIRRQEAGWAYIKSG